MQETPSRGIHTIKSYIEKINISTVETFLFFVVLTIGIPMVLLIPPGAGYDEEDHLVRVWELASLSFIPGQIPPQEMQYPKIYRDFAYRHQPGRLVDEDYWQKYRDASLYEYGHVTRELNTKSVYSPVLLLPQALVLRYVGRPADLSALTVFRLSRFAGLISYLILVLLAVRLIPFGKWILLVFAVSPIAMFQATTISADAISNGIGFLFIAGCLRLAQLNEINWKAWGALVFLVFLLFLAKLNLVPLILIPFLLIPPSRFANRGIYFSLLAMTLILFIVEVAGWNRIASLQLDPALANEADVTAQLTYILSDPFNFIQIILKDLFTNGWAYFLGWINGYGYYYWTPPPIVSFLFFLSLGSVIVADSALHPVDRRFRFAFILTFIASYFATILSLYATFTPVGADEILGVQGRYFVPLALLLFLVLSSFSAIKKITFSSLRWTLGFLSLALLLNVLGISLAFYVYCGTTYYQTALCYEPQFRDFSAEVRPSPPISGDMLINQEIQVTCNGLTELRVLLTPSIKEDKSTTRFILQDPLKAQNVFDVSIRNDEINIEDWYPLRFDPIWDSAGKQYQLKILSTNTQLGQGLRLLYSPQPEFDTGTLHENGQPLPENIVLQHGCVTGLRKIWLTGKP